MFIDQDTQFGYKYNLLTLVLLCVLTMSRLNVHLSFQMLIESFAGDMCNTAQDNFFFLQKTWFGRDSLVEMFWSHNITVSANLYFACLHHLYKYPAMYWAY